MKIDAVFSGGGVKAYAYVGAIQSIDQHNMQIERVAGTSAGAIVASLLAANYSVNELEHLIKSLDLNNFLDPPSLLDYIPIMKWLTIYFRLGIYKGNALENWLHNKLSEKGIETFAHIQEGYLKVVVSDLSLGKLVVIPDDLERVYGIKPENFSVATAVRMSAGFPYVFMPKYLQGDLTSKSVIVDGGLLSNFPLWVFNQKNNRRLKRPVLGIKLSESMENQQQYKISNALDMMKALVATMKNAHDSRYINTTEKKNIIFIPVKHVKTTDFSLTEQKKSKLIQLGYDTTEKFLAHWIP